jgi:hypothetical protein
MLNKVSQTHGSKHHMFSVTCGIKGGKTTCWGSGRGIREGNGG